MKGKGGGGENWRRKGEIDGGKEEGLGVGRVPCCYYSSNCTSTPYPRTSYCTLYEFHKQKKCTTKQALWSTQYFRTSVQRQS